MSNLCIAKKVIKLLLGRVLVSGFDISVSIIKI
ncbi:MAG: hypothetical protein H6Q74_1462 [Firmicutes bacterium]|nr:hypothetical protein [Bacillota bacterium]